MTLARRATLSLLLVAFTSVSLNAGEADIVKYRQSLMKAMGAYMSAIGAIAKGTVPFRTELAAHAAAVKDIAHAIPALFPAGTRPEKVKSGALPTVWSKPEEFRAATKKLESESARMQQLAGNPDAKSMATQFEAMKKACSSCHDTFRVKDAD